jgi:hypothetical protein
MCGPYYFIDELFISQNSIVGVVGVSMA